MNKIIGLAVLLFCLSGCVRDNDAIYYPVGNVDVERGGSGFGRLERVEFEYPKLPITERLSVTGIACAISG